MHYRDTTISLDPSKPPKADIVFVSHAHIDHTHTPSDGEKIIASNETAHLAAVRGYDLRDTREEIEGLELVDSGHILGARGLVVDGQIFYTGDIAGRPRGFLKSGRPVKCDTLIVESTYGLPNYRLPPVADVVTQTNQLISDLFSRGIPVVLTGYPLGKAQLLTYLFSSWEPIYVHGAIHKLNQAHSKLGVDIREDYTSYSNANEEGLLDKKPWIMLTPNFSGRNNFIRKLKEKYGAVTVGFSGWATDSSYKYARGLDHAFPLSDHCDFNELVELVGKCEPEKVYTVHGFAGEFASYLRKRGYDAEPLLGVQTSIADYVREP